MYYTEYIMWLLFAFLSAAFAALVAVFGKMGLKGVDSTVATAARSVIMAFTVLGLTGILGKLGEFGKLGGNDWLWIILSGLAGAASWIFYFAALKIGDASKVAAIDRTSIIIIVVLAALFLGEKLSGIKIIGATLIAIGAFLITR